MSLRKLHNIFGEALLHFRIVEGKVASARIGALYGQVRFPLESTSQTYKVLGSDGLRWLCPPFGNLVHCQSSFAEVFQKLLIGNSCLTCGLLYRRVDLATYPFKSMRHVGTRNMICTWHCGAITICERNNLPCKSATQ